MARALSLPAHRFSTNRKLCLSASRCFHCSHGFEAHKDDCRLKKQPNRDDALPSKGDQPVKDDPASQGSVADSSTAGSSPKLDPSSSGTKITNTTPSKGFHTLRSSAWSQQTRSSSLHTSSLSAQAKGDFALADIQDSSRDTAAAAEAKNAARGVASGSTRKDASATGRPSESAPTASEVMFTTTKQVGTPPLMWSLQHCCRRLLL